MRTLISRSNLTLVDKIKGIPFAAAYKTALNHQLLAHEQLLDLQAYLVTDICIYAKDNVKGYIEKYHSTFPGEIDPTKIPILEKNELITRTEQFVATETDRHTFLGSTSGSTGSSLTFRYDSMHAAWAEASKWRGRAWFGCSRGDPMTILWGRPIMRGSLNRKLLDPLKSWARNERHFNTFNSMDDRFFDRVLHSIDTRKPTLIYGYGSSIGRMATALYRKGITLNGKGNFLRGVWYTADHMTPTEKAAAAEVFGVPIISDYGASEAPGIAEECAKGHLHVSIDCYKVEVVNAEGEVLPKGTVGDLVITALHNRAMPLIRYRIGDVGRLVSGQCECGSPFPRMELVVGKSVDLITTSYADKVSAHYLDYININLMKRGLLGIEQFKLYQLGRDRFELHVVQGKGDLSKSAEEFFALLRDRLGPVDVTLKARSEIPLEATGKHRYFVNKCPA